MNWNPFKRKKKENDNFTETLLEYLKEARRIGWSDEKIKRKFMEKGYSEELIRNIFEINKMKGGKMVKQKTKDYDEEEFENPEESEEEEEVEEEPEEEEEAVKPKKKVMPTIKPKPKVNVGEIRPIYQIAGYQVLKGHDENGEEIWIQCPDLSIAEILSNTYKRE